MRELSSNDLNLIDYQGKLFEYSVSYLSCSSKIFIRRFIYSSLLKKLDENNASLLSLDVKEGLDEINNEFGDTDYGSIKYNKDILYWIGYLYRYISLTRKAKTHFIIKTFPVDLLISVYESYHTQDLDWVISSLLETKHYNEDYFNPNYRIKVMLQNNMLNYEYDYNTLIDLIKDYIKDRKTIKKSIKILNCSKKEFIKKVKFYKAKQI